MIDPHVHLRDWKQAQKETMAHGMEVAWQTGLDAVFDMPNTDPPLTDADAVRRRLTEAEAIIERLGIPFHYGAFCGATTDPHRLEKLVELYHGERLGRNGRRVGLVGFKLYAGPSTGDLAAEELEQQREIYRLLAELGYGGVVCVHCEKSSLFRRREDGTLDWDPAEPRTYARARPPESEVASVRDQLEAAGDADFAGGLHIAHVSVPDVVDLIEEARGDARFRISCEATPHHLLYSDDALSGERGLLFKTNPPLRSEDLRSELFAHLRAGRIDFIASDHAPHTLGDKLEGHASGVPGLFMMHLLRDRLRKEGFGDRLLSRLYHGGAEEIYGVEIPREAQVSRSDAGSDYPTNPYALDII